MVRSIDALHVIIQQHQLQVLEGLLPVYCELAPICSDADPKNQLRLVLVEGSKCFINLIVCAELGAEIQNVLGSKTNRLYFLF